MNGLLPHDTPEFTKGELLLIFQRIEEKLDLLNKSMANKHDRYDVELEKIRAEINDLRSFQTKAMTVWAVFVTIAGLILNNYF